MAEIKHYEEISFTHDDLVVLTSYMAEHNYTPQDVAYAVEKPHKHTDILEWARQELADGE